MLKNYLVIAFRNIKKYRAYSWINIIGLAVGMACCILTLLYVQNELSYDKYHENANRIYRLAMRSPGNTYGRGIEGIAKVPGPWGPAALQDLPEIERSVRFMFFNQTLVSRGEKRFYENNGFYADSTVFDIFSFNLFKGNPKTALKAPFSLILTQDMARKYFGSEDPIGQFLLFDNTTKFQVTGVLENVPQNSHFTFSFLVSLSSDTSTLPTDWVRNQYYTYLLLKKSYQDDAVAKKFPSVLAKNIGEEAANYIPFLQPLLKIHLHSNLFREIESNSDFVYIIIFSTVAIFILITACINFINLATASSANRALEVGIRKVVGASQQGLIRQFIGESFVLSLIALLIAIILVYFFLPSFNSLLDKQFDLISFVNPMIILGLLGICLFVGIVSGCYPAFVVSAFAPSDVLKGKFKITSHSSLRKTLVVFQFVVSIILIISTGHVYKQLEYIRNKKLGFNQEHLVIVPIQDESMRQNHESFKRELLQHPSVLDVSTSANMPGGSDYGIPIVPEGIPEGETSDVRQLIVDHAFLATYQMKLLEGRDFSKDYLTDASSAYLINEAAAKQLGWDNPIGKTIAIPGIGRNPGSVIGIVENFHFRSMHQRISPLILYIQPPNWYSRFSIRIHSENLPETLDYIKLKWTEFDPVNPFSYTFFDSQFAQLHQAEEKTKEMIGYFSVVAVIIGCLGLFGLVSFATQKRTKEIGIRKVHGASVSSILKLLSKEFILVISFALFLAVPISYFILDTWLNNFAYRININVEIFLFTGGLIFLITLITVSYQTIKAATANPIKSIRHE